MSSEAVHQGAAVSKPPWEEALIVKFRNYATRSRNFRKPESLTPELKTAASDSQAHQKSQTLSDKFRKLSAPSRESVRPKIHTLSGQFRRRCLRNLELAAGEDRPACRKPFNICPPTHPRSLWLRHAQMWRVFLSAALRRGATA
jgi:hypothetical protein